MLRRNAISKGFRIKWTPSYNTSSEENMEINNILQDTSRRLMTVVNSHNKEKLDIMNENVKVMWSTAREEHSSQELKYAESPFERYVERTCMVMKKMKNKKLQQYPGKQEENGAKWSKENLDNFWFEKIGVTSSTFHSPQEPQPYMNGPYKWMKYPIKSDGNCFFRAVSVLLFDTEECHIDVWNEVIKYMCGNTMIFVNWWMEICTAICYKWPRPMVVVRYGLLKQK